MLARIAAVAARNTVEVPVVIAYLLGGCPSKNAESVLADGQEYDVLLMHRSIVSHPDAKLPATADKAAKVKSNPRPPGLRVKEFRVEGIGLGHGFSSRGPVYF